MLPTVLCKSSKLKKKLSIERNVKSRLDFIQFNLTQKLSLYSLLAKNDLRCKIEKRERKKQKWHGHAVQHPMLKLRNCPTGLRWATRGMVRDRA
jgi:hypothetical protein